MKLRQQHVKQFRDDVRELQESLPGLVKACDEWLSTQRERESYGNVDQYWARRHREVLERKLDEFRETIGEIYDFMAERGLRDIDAVAESEV